MHRCILCDYTSEEGSDYADLPPGLLRVRPATNGDFLCDDCANQADENLFDLEVNDEE